jgi:hypothetical protein
MMLVPASLSQILFFWRQLVCLQSLINVSRETGNGRWLSINGDRQMTALKLTSRSLETGE